MADISFDGKYPNPIPMDQCVDGHVYWIAARNSCVGLFRAARGAFTIARTKFESTYLFDEYRWDKGMPFGTARAFKDLGPVPEGMNEGALLTYLDRLADDVSKQIDEGWKRRRAKEGKDAP